MRIPSPPSRIRLEAGDLRCLVRNCLSADGELAFPIGLHLASDYLQGTLFGVVNTGAHYGSVLVLAPSGSSTTRWTGLPYGVEAGVLGTVAFTTGIVIIVAWMRGRRGTDLEQPLGAE